MASLCDRFPAKCSELPLTDEKLNMKKKKKWNPTEVILLRFVVLSRAGGYLLSVTYNTVTGLKTISILSGHFAVQKDHKIYLKS